MRGGFTLVELVVVIAVIAVLMSILMPALSKIRRQARSIRGMNNQRQIVIAVSSFAEDNDDFYPDSVATVGTIENGWNWHEPMKVKGHTSRSPGARRSVSAYLRTYLPEAESVYCPSAPRRYDFFDDAWVAGDEWDNPDTPMRDDPLTGTYCFYWNYTGFIESRERFFEGPRGPVRGGGQSGLLVSCFFGYSQFRSRGDYGSCEMFRNAELTEGTDHWPSYWSGQGEAGSSPPAVRLWAGYTDGRVESYLSWDTVVMSVIRYPETGETYPSHPTWIGPGNFHLPRNALP